MVCINTKNNAGFRVELNWKDGHGDSYNTGYGFGSAINKCGDKEQKIALYIFGDGDGDGYEDGSGYGNGKILTSYNLMCDNNASGIGITIL